MRNAASSGVTKKGGHSYQPVPQRDISGEGGKKKSQLDTSWNLRLQSGDGKSKHIHVRQSAPICHRAKETGHRVKQTSLQLSALSLRCISTRC